MSMEAIFGMLILNAGILCCGAAIIWAAVGVRDWGHAASLAGLAYFVGLGTLGSLLAVGLVAGVPLRGWVMLAVWAVVMTIALLAGRRRRQPIPGRVAVQMTLADAVGFGATAVLAEALFRAGRLHGLYSWDAWAFWVPKAKLVYWTGHLAPAWLAQLASPTYPPLLPILEAADFHALRGPDTVTLHLQFWIVAVAFAAALLGLLWDRTPRVVLWSSVLLVLAAPRFGSSLLEPQADFLLDCFFVLGALLVLRWLTDHESVWLFVAAPLLAGAALTKREGSLFVVCLAVAVGLTAGRDGVRRWRVLVAPFAIAAVAALAWRVWFTSHHLPGDLPHKLGFGGGLDWARAGDSLRLSLDVLASTSRWSATPWLGLLGLVAAAVAGNRRLAAAVLLLVTLLVLGGAWTTYAYPEWGITANESLNPIVRYTGATELLILAMVPLLLATVAPPPWMHALLRPVRTRTVLAAIAGVALVYPTATLAHGLPRFPSGTDCVRKPVAGQPVAVVFGRFTTEEEATRAEARAHAVGFQGLRVEQDGCGRLVLWIPNAPDVKTAESVVAEARTAKLDAHAELGHG